MLVMMQADANAIADGEYFELLSCLRFSSQEADMDSEGLIRSLAANVSIEATGTLLQICSACKTLEFDTAG
jgi:hypothetical protein